MTLVRCLISTPVNKTTINASSVTFGRVRLLRMYSNFVKKILAKLTFSFVCVEFGCNSVNDAALCASTPIFENSCE